MNKFSNPKNPLCSCDYNFTCQSCLRLSAGETLKEFEVTGVIAMTITSRTLAFDEAHAKQRVEHGRGSEVSTREDWVSTVAVEVK